MRECLATALTDIRTLIAEAVDARKAHHLVHRIRLRMLEARIELDEMVALDCQYDAEGNERSDEDAASAWAEVEGDTEMEFIHLCAACWSLATCKNAELLTTFAEDSTTGYAVFADDINALEYEPKYINGSKPERRYAEAFPLYPWVELCEDWDIRTEGRVS